MFGGRFLVPYRAASAFSQASLLAGICVACASPPAISAREAADANDTGRTSPARTDLERRVLRDLPQQPSGVARRIADVTVVVDEPYSAASGRTCRSIHFSGGASVSGARLACNAGSDWFFVPDVFGARE